MFSLGTNSTPDVSIDGEGHDEYFTIPRSSLRHPPGVRAVSTHAQAHAPSAQSAIVEGVEDEETSYVIDTCPPTPLDPFLTPAHSPSPSAPGSTHNLNMLQLAATNTSHISFGFAGLANPTMSRVSTTPGTLSSPSTPPTPYLPLQQHRSSRLGNNADPSTTLHIRRESFASPPKMIRPSSSVSLHATQHRISQRPGAASVHGSSAHLTPPGSAGSSHALSEKAAMDAAFQIDRDQRKVYTAKRMECKMLLPGTIIEKPWLTTPVRRARIAYWLTVIVTCFGVVASFLRCWFGIKGVRLLEGNLCPVFDDEFDGNSIDTTKWTWDVAMDGFGNGEFEMMTNSPNNSFVEDGILYIVPTYTSDVIGSDAIFNGYTFNITDCNASNSTGCGAVSNQTTKTVINPIQSARLTTRNISSIRYGKVEIRAKIPTGDWLWPALWMLPVDDTYGPWPISGEIDIMEARGNSRSYAAQGVDVVRASLNWGPLTWLNEAFRTYGWWSARRATYNQGFHTYTLEWSEKFIRASVDSRLHFMLDLNFDEPFFNRGEFPPTVSNGSNDIPVPNPWGEDSFSAPFDQSFYLIMDVAVGGTNGWFPDNVGNKPWLDQSSTAMYDFARAQDSWSSTWPEDVRQRGMAIDYVKMWQLC